MITTEQDIMDFIEEYDVKFIRLAFFDLYGNQKNISIMPSEVPHALSKGMSIDASAIKGFKNLDDSDLFLVPDISTLAILPWRPQVGRVVRMFCDIYYPNGKPFALDTRKMLKDTLLKYRDCGYDMMAGTECEFYLFLRDDDGKPTRIPYDEASYCDIAPLDKGENVRREICLELEEMGIMPESSHHEQGPGQNEIDFKFDDILSACDHLMTFKNVVDIVALQNGLKADFSPKPLVDHAGNGLHLNMSLFQNGENVFAKSDDILHAFIAGILKHIKEMTIFLNPMDNSYERLGHDKAPKYIAYSRSNRSALIRIPAADQYHTRIELRSPDPVCNPYIAFVLLIEAGMEGIKQHAYVKESTGDLYKYHDNLESLPQSLEEAKQCAQESTFVKSVLPQPIIDWFCQL